MTVWMMHQETHTGMNYPGSVEQGFVTFPSRLKQDLGGCFSCMSLPHPQV